MPMDKARELAAIITKHLEQLDDLESYRVPDILCAFGLITTQLIRLGLKDRQQQITAAKGFGDALNASIARE